MAVALPTILRPLEALYETDDLPAFDLPDELAVTYGSSFGLSEPRVYANFVSTLDGVVALPQQLQSSRMISGGSAGDRFVMGLLRASADAVLVGAGTLMGSPRTLWTAEHAYPPAAELYAELRRRRGRPPQPTLAVLSGSGGIDPQHPGLHERSLVLTSEQGAARLGNALPASATIVCIGGRPTLDPASVVQALRAGGHELILCEGGPTVLGILVEAGLVDELFLTISPLLAGRESREPRPGLIQDVAFLPSRSMSGRLLSIRRGRSDLFLRYALARSRRARARPVP